MLTALFEVTALFNIVNRAILVNGKKIQQARKVEQKTHAIQGESVHEAYPSDVTGNLS